MQVQDVFLKSDIFNIEGWMVSVYKHTLFNNIYNLYFIVKNIIEMKCKNKTASCNDETCSSDEMFGLKEDPLSQE